MPKDKTVNKKSIFSVFKVPSAMSEHAGEIDKVSKETGVELGGGLKETTRIRTKGFEKVVAGATKPAESPKSAPISNTPAPMAIKAAETKTSKGLKASEMRAKMMNAVTAVSNTPVSSNAPISPKKSFSDRDLSKYKGATFRK